MYPTSPEATRKGGGEGATLAAAVWLHTPEGGDSLRITFHIWQLTVTIIVKRGNRHPAR